MATRSILSTRSEKGTSLTSRSAVTVVTSIFYIQPVDLCTSITLSVIFVSFLKIKFSSVHYKHVAPCKIFVKAYAFFLPLKLSQASCSQVFPVFMPSQDNSWAQLHVYWTYKGMSTIYWLLSLQETQMWPKGLHGNILVSCCFFKLHYSYKNGLLSL